MTARSVQYTAPEQLFAAAWSASFIDALRLAAASLDITLAPGLAIDAEVQLCTAGDASLLQARFTIRMPGLERDVADTLVALARRMCPYSSATRGDIDLRVNVA